MFYQKQENGGKSGRSDFLNIKKTQGSDLVRFLEKRFLVNEVSLYIIHVVAWELSCKDSRFVCSNGKEIFIHPHTAAVIATPIPSDGELTGSDGSESGEAEDSETGRAFFIFFLNLETGQAGVFQ